jgi:hypothetical protein
MRQLQERALILPALVLAQLQEGRRGLDTQQQEAWLSKGRIAGRWLRLIPCSRPIWLILLFRMMLLGRPFYGIVLVSPTPGETFKDGPGGLAVLARLFDAVLRVATTGTVARYYGPNEELGLALFLGAFDGDTVGLAHTVLADTPPSWHCVSPAWRPVGTVAGISSDSDSQAVVGGV